MELWRIHGGTPLYGECEVQGSKNAALPILTAALCARTPSRICGVPKLSDVEITLQILRTLGCTVLSAGTDSVYIDPSAAREAAVPKELMGELRSSVLFLGALLARCGEAEITQPGGCRIGERPIDLHLDAFRKLGVEVTEEDGRIRCRRGDCSGGELSLPYPSVGATENVMLLASALPGKTVLRNAAREPEVLALQEYLRSCGVRIFGAECGRITVDGYTAAEQVEYRIPKDRMAEATLCCACAGCGGDIRIFSGNPRQNSSLLYFLNKAGCDIIIENSVLRIRSRGRLRGIGTVVTRPYPGFPTDAQPLLCAALLRSDGESRIYDSVFPARFSYTEELRAVGSELRPTENGVCICGKASLHGGVMTAGDLRGGAAMLLAALQCEEESAVWDAGYIRRGYERLDEIFSELSGRESVRILRCEELPKKG